MDPSLFVAEFTRKESAVYWAPFLECLQRLFAHFTKDDPSHSNIIQAFSLFNTEDDILNLPKDDPYYEFYYCRVPISDLGPNNTRIICTWKSEKPGDTPCWCGTPEKYLAARLTFFTPRMIWAYNDIKAVVAEGEIHLEQKRREVERLSCALAQKRAGGGHHEPAADTIPDPVPGLTGALGTGVSARERPGTQALMEKKMEKYEELWRGKMGRVRNRAKIEFAPEHHTGHPIPATKKGAHIPDKDDERRWMCRPPLRQTEDEILHELVLHPWRREPVFSVPDMLIKRPQGEILMLNYMFLLTMLADTGPVPETADELFDLQKTLAEAEAELAVGEYVKEKRMARLNTIRKCLGILLDTNLLQLVVHGDSYIRALSNRAVHSNNPDNKVVADALSRVKLLIDRYHEAEDRTPKWNLQIEITKLASLLKDENNCFNSDETFLEQEIDANFIGPENWTRLDDKIGLVTWLEKTFPIDRV